MSKSDELRITIYRTLLSGDLQVSKPDGSTEIHRGPFEGSENWPTGINWMPETFPRALWRASCYGPNYIFPDSLGLDAWLPRRHQ